MDRSLILREINFPNPLKDELIALIEEANSTNDKNDKNMSIFEYTFFQNALIGSLLASILCGFIGTYIVTRRWYSLVVVSLMPLLVE